MPSAIPDPAAGGRPDFGQNWVPPPTPGRGFLRRAGRIFRAILRHRCPRCHRGRMFRGVFTMNDPCPVCGLLFKREEGTFLGAMYVSYVLAGALMAAIYFPLGALLPGLDGITLTSLTTVAFLPFTPLIFRYSRTLWIHFERAGSPSGQSATAYEKVRLRELERQRGEGNPGPSDRGSADESAGAEGDGG